MMNALYNDILWSNIKYIGFDLDGTLYDEFDFIIQPYEEISKLFNNSYVVFSYMSARWLEKGSSYNYIFDETYNLFNDTLSVKSIEKNEFIQACLEIYREYSPTLTLCNRTKEILNSFNNNATTFLVTDGNPILQEKKFRALGLDNYFHEKHICFTGKQPSLYEKPRPESLSSLNIEADKAVFFGDRNVDLNYAINSGMQFQHVYNMLPLK